MLIIVSEFFKTYPASKLSIEELAKLQGFRKEGEANKANNGGSDSKLNNKVLKEYPPCEHVPLKKVHLSVTCLRRLASLLLDVKMDDVEQFLYTLPPYVKEQLVTLIIEEYHKRCAKG